MVLLGLAAPCAARAAAVPGAVIAGPSAELAGVPALALAPDGTGVVAYLQLEGGTVRVWASRRAGSVWGAPQQLTGGMQASVGRIRVGAANGGRAIVAFRGAADPDAAAFRHAPGSGQPFGALTVIRPSGVNDLALATNAAGVSYALVSANPGRDLFAYRITGDTVAPVGAPTELNGDPARAGFITARSIAVDAAGNAIAAWAETTAGANAAFARRITGTALGSAALNATAPSLEGFPAGSGGAAEVGVDTDDSGRGWLALRQEFNYGGGEQGFRGVVRRLVGAAFEPALRTDTLSTPPPAGRDVELPSIAVTPDGTRALATGHANLGASGTAPYAPFGALVTPGSAGPFGLHPTASPEETFSSVAIVPRGAGLFAFPFEDSPTGAATLRARVMRQDGGLDPGVLTLSDPALGSVALAGVSAVPDGADAVSVGYAQGAGANRRVLVATVDLPRPPPAAARDTTPPSVSRFRLSRKRFRKGRRLVRLSAARTGTTIRFTLSETASVRLGFERRRAGRRVGGKCRKPTRRNRRHRRCTRHVKVRTTVGLRGKAGPNRVGFQGRLTRRRSLAPGRYRVVLVATDAAGNASRPRRRGFRLLRAAGRRR